ncbi:MAG: ABC transporter ATP-binding protein [Planctomycetota bacterium]|jgi:putative ABC transport system ATP-binding protein
MSDAVLRMHGVRVERGRGGDAFRLEVPEVDLEAGAVLACIGPSGCGKTTLLHAATGILPVAGGTCELAGRDLAGMDDAARRAWRLRTVGMVFQDFGLLEYLTAEQNILLTARLARLPRRASRERAHALAERLGIQRLLRRRPSRLSQGERQRVAICRALVPEPRLLACDEPTGTLDPDRAAATVELIRERATEIDAAVLLITHDHGLLDRCDRVLDLAAAGARP